MEDIFGITLKCASNINCSVKGRRCTEIPNGRRPPNGLFGCFYRPNIPERKKLKKHFTIGILFRDFTMYNACLTFLQILDLCGLLMGR